MGAKNGGVIARKEIKLCALFLLLNILYILPSHMLPGDALAVFSQRHGFRLIFSFFWLSADLVAAFAWLLWANKKNWGLWRYRLIAVGLGGLYLYEIYDVAIVSAFRRKPVLYDDILLLSRGFHLLTDLSASMGAKILFAGLGIIAIIALITGLIPHLDHIVREIPEKHLRKILWAYGSAAFFFLSLAQFDRSLAQRDNGIQSPFLRFIHNLQTSATMRTHLAAIDATNVDSTNLREPSLHLTVKPNIVLFIVEAYGSVLWSTPSLRTPHLEVLAGIESRLRTAGWHIRTQRSTSPVYGGRSWLAIATVLGGVRIENQHTYHRFLQTRARHSLPNCLAKAGYATATLEPATRTRPGLPLTNPYQFQHGVWGDDLKYHGPTYGWGIVPDQYSLGFAQEQKFVALQQPYFIYFMTVSTHMPWHQIPPLVEDWRTLNEDHKQSLTERLSSRIQQRFVEQPKNNAGSYQQAIAYDLEVLTRHILQYLGEPKTIVIIMGDHQPLLSLDQKNDMATPLHILSRDAEYLHALDEYGFIEGMTPPEQSTPPLKHEGLFSLLRHSLSRTYGKTNEAPAYEPDGAPLTVLRR